LGIVLVLNHVAEHSGYVVTVKMQGHLWGAQSSAEGQVCCFFLDASSISYASSTLQKRQQLEDMVPACAVTCASTAGAMGKRAYKPGAFKDGKPAVPTIVSGLTGVYGLVYLSLLLTL
jgi:hypothetical protein